MQDQLIESLRREIQEGTCLIVVGTGVTAGATGADIASWPGLLRSGLRRAQAQGRLNEHEVSTINSLIDAGGSDDLMHAAEKLVTLMGGPAHGSFGQWLREDLGYLSRSVTDKTTIQAIGNLKLPILTTNYDDTIEKVLGRDYTTWQSKEGFQGVVRGASDDILHLHGHWKHKESIILTSSQYAEMLADPSVTALRHAMVSLNTLIYIGFGEGLSDPNFTRLRDWVKKTLSFQEFNHYRLCRASQLQHLQAEHREDMITPLSYGEGYEALAPFLESLAPAAATGDDRQVQSPFEIIEERVRETAVLSPYVPRSDEARISDLLIPPVLMPVTSDQLIAEAEANATQTGRCELPEELKNTHMVLAGDDHVGVSSALLWLCAEMYLRDNTLTPVTVDYLKLGGGPTPLRKQVAKALRASGRGVRDDEALPPILLVLDNVNAANPTRIQRVAAELDNDAYARVLIGCKTASETQIAETLVSAGLPIVIRHVGRLGRGDVRALANLIDPSRARDLTRAAARVVDEHQLPSTPFTMSMILGALTRGESLLSATSPTSLLDAYIEALLGRGSRDDDPRLGFDSRNHSDILARLAAEFVTRGRGSLSEVETIAALTETLTRYGWTGQASDLLHEYRERRILLLRNREVSFTQNSYLYLFAAKFALDKPEFLAILTEEPLYYAPILSHYAALKRSDWSLVARLVPALLDPFSDLPLSEAPAFLPIDSHEVQHHVPDAELDQHFKRNTAAAPADDDDESDLTPLGRDQHDDVLPFPLLPVDEEPTVARAFAALGLSSNLLRDTEIVEDQAARRELFVQTLRTYQVLVNLVANEHLESATALHAAEEMAQQLAIPARRVEKFIDDVMMMIPLAVAFAAISASLSTAKLERLIEQCLEDDEFNAQPELVILAFYILFDVHGPGWTKALPVLEAKHSTIRAVRTIVARMSYFAYVRRSQKFSDNNSLESFLIDQAIGQGSGPNMAARRDRALKSIQRARLQSSRSPEIGQLGEEEAV